ncbi:MAG: hypothetical protein M3082_14445 [Candidatus Dormibacteraeota bacterium]|nr:hypothetical protein [Candidatus Dormibacteraeota bacterium]
MRLSASIMLIVLIGACQSPPVNRPVPTVAQIGADLNCPTPDHGFEDSEAGWGFCYPATWKYFEKSQVYLQPIHRLDLTFDVTDVPCVLGTPAAGETPHPVCSPGAGLFGFVIISTWDRGTAPDLATWMKAYLSPLPAAQPIVWGNASEAAKLSDGRRIALTPHHVVILDLRAGVGQLDLEAAMSSRLNSWRFTY